ncbi:ATP-binding cassette domain-containing protein [Diaphorobacter aerolatus]|uniref:Probable ATP-binding protein YheS n=1 Tax=Diaphorobacter aerolatus TaxID=1288495 RepID=A0A7H0GL01_9BURK|nr:ATP-binding cassette domain-containing protein [Diaphorobacter aerolatus]
MNSFSGGWRMRLQLARALMSPSDLLLLDEPTNHLDLDALVWLEAWLKRYAGTLIVISHDREFLDAVTDVTLHIENAKLTRYGGNYSKFEELRAQQLVLQQSSYERQQDKIAHLQKFIDRFKAKASKAKQAQSRVKAIERMEKIAPVLASADFSFEFKEPANLPNPMLAISDASFGYRTEDGMQATTILHGVNRSVLAGQRIGILGANGQGKSTLVKTIAREMSQLAGTVTEGKGLNIGYFAQQELDVLRPDDSPLVHMVRLAKELGPDSKEPSREQDLRNYLGSFNFNGDMVGQAVGTMSGGEKARLVLAMIVWQRPNLLLLDEPTNHLDLTTREALSMAINSFDGTVMLVSHDRALLRSVCDDFWLVGRGKVDPFDGDLDDYQRYLLDESKRLREQARQSQETVVVPVQVVAQAPAIDASQGKGDPREQRRLAALARQQVAEKTKPYRKELDQIDKRLPQLASERAALELKLATAGLSGADIAEAGRQLKAVNDSIERSEERWLELSGQIEAIQQEMGATA